MIINENERNLRKIVGKFSGCRYKIFNYEVIYCPRLPFSLIIRYANCLIIVFINTGWERKYMWPFVLTCIVDKSLCFLWPWWRCVYCHLCNKVLDIDNLVSVFLFILVFLIEKLWVQKDVVFYGINCFFLPQITIACKNYTSPVNRKSTDWGLWLKQNIGQCLFKID